MDFIIGLPESAVKTMVYDTVLGVIDRFTKIVKCILVTMTIDAYHLAQVLFDSVVLAYGMLDGIVSDRGSMFTRLFINKTQSS